MENPVRNFTDEELEKDLVEILDSIPPTGVTVTELMRREKDVEEKEEASYTKPRYYGGEENVYEVIKIIEHYNLSFCAGNALKYLIRAGKKSESDEIHDLNKGLWYFKREIENRKKARDADKT